VAKILYVEDDEATRLTTNMLLQAIGHETVEAINGADALKKLDSAETPFDLILTDHQMPTMDGIALARAVRSRNLAIPITMLAGHDEAWIKDYHKDDKDQTPLDELGIRFALKPCNDIEKLVTDSLTPRLIQRPAQSLGAAAASDDKPTPFASR